MSRKYKEVELFVKRRENINREEVIDMPYSVKSKKSGATYYLFNKEVTLRGGRKQMIYYFTKDENNSKGNPVNELPSGYTTMENSRTGLPMLKKA
jgi:hypothetical protein